MRSAVELSYTRNTFELIDPQIINKILKRKKNLYNNKKSSFSIGLSLFFYNKQKYILDFCKRAGHKKGYMTETNPVKSRLCYIFLFIINPLM